MAAYQYRKLADEGEFRLLTLRPSNDASDEIQCDLAHHPVQVKGSLQSNADLQYEALSWTWGGDSSGQGVPLMIFDKSQGSPATGAPLTVKPNLAAALRAMRSADNKQRRLWVDYVCIDQQNDKEKNSQVQMMYYIYGNASNVCIWLGEDGDRGEKALKFVEEDVCDFTKFRELTAADTSGVIEENGWYALACLMNRGWFKRRWVVQEVALARAATVHVGRKSIKWQDFETAVTLFEQHSRHLDEIHKGSKNLDYDRSVFGDVAAMGATRLVRTKGEVFRWSGNGDILEPRLTLSQLVVDLFDFEAREPHDLVYALLSLASDTRPGLETPQETPSAPPPSDDADASSGNKTNEPTLSPADIMTARRATQKMRQNMKTVFPVNYQQPVFEVFKEFLRFVMSKGQYPNIDILCQPWADPDACEDLPSWIPSAENAAFGPRVNKNAAGGVQIKRKNADPLVGPRPYDKPYYNACSGLVAMPGERFDWHFSKDPMERSLFVTGFILDRIDVIEESSQNGNIPAEWLTLGEWQPWTKKDCGKAPPDELWQTILADQGSDGQRPKLYFRKAFEFCVAQSTRGTGLQIVDLQYRSHPIVVEFLTRMEAVVWGRKLYRSKTEERLGLAPKKAKTGDAICVLRGCSVPVVLRQINKADGSGSHYKFIGETYLHTMMYGAALERRAKKGIAWQKFELR